MTMQTEKLDNKIRDIIAKYHNQVPFADEVPEILKACKEAGLTFTDYSTDDEGNIILQGLEEIEVD